MFRNISIGFKLTLGFSIILVVFIITFIYISLNHISDIIDRNQQNELINLYQKAQSQLENKGNLAKALSTVIASVPETQDEFARQDRKALAKWTVPLFSVLKRDFAARQFQFHLPPATSFLRAHKPQKYGDDLSSFRKTVVKTNQDKVSIEGLEKGVAGLGIRGIVPVFKENKHLGSVEFGMSFGKPFFLQFKKDSGAEIALFVIQGSGFKLFASTLDEEHIPDTQLMRQALENKPQYFINRINSISFASYLHVINDFSGNPIGVMEISINRTPQLDILAAIKNNILFTGLIFIVLGILFSLWLSRSITGPIKETVTAMNNIAEGDGDLTLRLNEQGKDEISQLAKAFNSFAEKVRMIVCEVAVTSSVISESAERMSELTTKTSSEVTKQQNETHFLATIINQVSESFIKVSTQAFELVSSAKDADVLTQEGQAVVLEVVESITILEKEIELAASAITHLVNETTNIGNVLEVIRSVSEQTNLLALNAAIEAARAGEHGRGFAVVADEVRTLASRTNDSTEEIQQMIERIQKGTQESVNAITNSKEKSMESVAKAKQAGNSLHQIAEAVNIMKQMNENIASISKEEAKTVAEVSDNIEKISDIAMETSNRAEESNFYSESLVQLLHKLESLVRRFRT